MDELISREAVLDYLTIIPIDLGYREIEDVERFVQELPSAHPKIKPIDYQDCANAMLRMWMDNVVTDGEYNRIMDKLNAFWRARHE